MLSDLVVCYLFLGGTGAGLCLVLSVLGLLVPRSCLSTPPGVHLHPSAAYRKLLGSARGRVRAACAGHRVFGGRPRQRRAHDSAARAPDGIVPGRGLVGARSLPGARGGARPRMARRRRLERRPRTRRSCGRRACVPRGHGVHRPFAAEPRRGALVGHAVAAGAVRGVVAVVRHRVRACAAQITGAASAFGAVLGRLAAVDAAVIVVEAAIVAVFVYAASRAGAPLSNGTELAAAQSGEALVAGRTRSCSGAASSYSAWRCRSRWTSCSRCGAAHRRASFCSPPHACWSAGLSCGSALLRLAAPGAQLDGE